MAGQFANDGITQAYQNDPRMKLAQQLVQTGTSTAPVAGGKFGYIDGIARALTGITGAWTQRSLNKDYAKHDEAVSGGLADAFAQYQREKGLAANTGGAGSPPAVGQPAPAGVGGAGPVGAVNAQPMPPVPSTPQNVAPAPQMPPAPAPTGAPNPAIAQMASVLAPGGPPAPGGAPAGQMQPPAPPAQIAPPEAVMPSRPESGARGPSAYTRIAEILSGSKDPFVRAEANKYRMKGLETDVDREDRAYEFKDKLTAAEYEAGLGDFFATKSDARRASADEKSDARKFDNDVKMFEKNAGLQLTLEQRREAADMRKAGFDRDTSFGLASLNNDAAYKRSLLEIDAKRGDAAQKRNDRRSLFFSTAAGAKMAQSVNDSIGKADEVVDKLEAFKAKNAKIRTGGILNNVPGGEWAQRTFGSGGATELKALTESLVPNFRMPNDPFSDGDRKAVGAALANIQNKTGTNNKIIDTLVAGQRRKAEYQRAMLEAQASGDTGTFPRSWEAYRNSVPLFDKNGNPAPQKTYPEWRDSLRKVQ